MRLGTKDTWFRIALLFVSYMVLSALSFGLQRVADDGGMAALFGTLLALLPVVTVILAAWDGGKEELSILWMFVLIACFLLPMFVFFNYTALIYGAAYSVLAMVANAIGALFHRTNSDS
ncbi:iron ABC transporter [Trueperella pecoris]|uniref:iron ABC transporter n=1 Tax=Trueperella pecoris TaxID=2733571 RepID=UPI001ABE0796|nr:iron ABC transporter [Trueperella pecoris]QTG75284.1 iron ABC transporter [Trueperella pecoris]